MSGQVLRQPSLSVRGSGAPGVLREQRSDDNILGNKGETMKSAAVNGKQKTARFNGRTLTLALLLGVLLFLSAGCSSFCSAYPGETAAEANRRHKRVLCINKQEMLADIDTVLMLDRPSHLTDRRLP